MSSPSSNVRLSREMRLIDITRIGAGIFVLTGLEARVAGPAWLPVYLLNRMAITILTAAIVLVELNFTVWIVTGAFFLAFGSLCLTGLIASGCGSGSSREAEAGKRMDQSKSDRPDKPDDAGK